MKKLYLALSALLATLAIAVAADNFPIGTFGGSRTVLRSTDNSGVHTLNVLTQPSSQYPTTSAGVTATPITASATGTTGSVAATLAAAVGKTTHICGFTITFSNPTAGTNVTNTVANVVTGTLSYTRQVLAAAATVQAAQDLSVQFSPCVPANATNTTIVVTQPGLGAGATSTSVNAWGYQL